MKRLLFIFFITLLICGIFLAIQQYRANSFFDYPMDWTEVKSEYRGTKGLGGVGKYFKTNQSQEEIYTYFKEKGFDKKNHMFYQTQYIWPFTKQNFIIYSKESIFVLQKSVYDPYFKIKNRLPWNSEDTAN